MNVPGGISIPEQLCYLQNEGKNFDIAQCLIDLQLHNSLQPLANLLWIIPLIIGVILILSKRKQ